MSRTVVDTGFETDGGGGVPVLNDAAGTPLWTLSGTISRSNAAPGPLAGTWSLVGGDGTAKDGSASYNFLSVDGDRTKVGSIKGFRMWAKGKFKLVSGPTGGRIFVLKLSGTGNEDFDLTVEAGTTKLTLYDDARANVCQTGATALGSSTHTIEIDARNEGGGSYGSATQFWVRVWLDSDRSQTPEIDFRAIASGAVQVRWDDVISIVMGVQAAAKCSWQAVWDDWIINLAADPSGSAA